MIIPDKKKAVTVILSKMGGKEAPMKPEESIGDDSLKALAEDVLMAIEEKSAQSLSVALKAFMDECELSEGDEEVEE